MAYDPRDIIRGLVDVSLENPLAFYLEILKRPTSSLNRLSMGRIKLKRSTY